VPITQYGLAHNYWWILSERYCDPFRLVASSPMNHLAMLGDAVALATVAGGAMIVLERFDPLAVLRTIERESITYVKGTPTHYLLMIEAAGERPDFDLSSLQYLYWSGAPIPRKNCLATRSMMRRRWVEAFLATTIWATR